MNYCDREYLPGVTCIRLEGHDGNHKSKYHVVRTEWK